MILVYCQLRLNDLRKKRCSFFYIFLFMMILKFYTKCVTFPNEISLIYIYKSANNLFDKFALLVYVGERSV